MSPNQWGPPTWRLFHIMAEKIKEDKYPIIGMQLYSHIVQICYQLPCPECAEHAKLFLSKINANNLKTKHDLKNMLYVFHNAVNNRKKMPFYKYEDLEIYKNKNIIQAFNDFSKNFTSNGNMKLLADNFQRRQMLSTFKKWIMQNVSNFDM